MQVRQKALRAISHTVARFQHNSQCKRYLYRSQSLLSSSARNCSNHSLFSTSSSSNKNNGGIGKDESKKVNPNDNPSSNRPALGLPWGFIAPSDANRRISALLQVEPWIVVDPLPFAELKSVAEFEQLMAFAYRRLAEEFNEYVRTVASAFGGLTPDIFRSTDLYNNLTNPSIGKFVSPQFLERLRGFANTYTAHDFVPQLYVEDDCVAKLIWTGADRPTESRGLRFSPPTYRDSTLEATAFSDYFLLNSVCHITSTERFVQMSMDEFNAGKTFEDLIEEIRKSESKSGNPQIYDFSKNNSEDPEDLSLPYYDFMTASEPQIKKEIATIVTGKRTKRTHAISFTAEVPIDTFLAVTGRNPKSWYSPIPYYEANGSNNSLFASTPSLWDCLSAVSIKPRLSNLEMLKKPFRVLYPSMTTWPPAVSVLDPGSIGDLNASSAKNPVDDSDDDSDDDHDDSLPVIWRINSLNGSNH